MLGLDDTNLIVTIIETGNFSNAAKALYISQSSIVKKVRKIEKDLGYEIFIRKKGFHKIELTQKGKELIPLIKKINNLYSQSIDIKYNDKINIKIASSDGPYIWKLDNIILDLLKISDKYIFKLKSTSYRECIDALRENLVDLAFIGNNIYSNDIKIENLFEEEFVLISSKKTDTINKNYKLKDLDLNNCVYSSYNSEFSNWFKTFFNHTKPRIQCDLVDQVAYFLSKTKMWSIVPKSMSEYIANKTEINIFNITEKLPNRVLYCARRMNDQNKEIDKFLEILKSYI